MNSFFSKDCFSLNLKRSPSIRARKHQQPTNKRSRLCPSKSVKGLGSLHVIPELSEFELDESESESVSHSSSSSHNATSARCTLYPSLSHQPCPSTSNTRQRTPSDTSIVDFETEKRGEERLSAYEFSIDDTLLLAPRPAPSPPARGRCSTGLGIPRSPSPSLRSFLSPPGSPSRSESLHAYQTETTTEPEGRREPAYLTALSSSPDFDSFRLTFSDMSLTFPHPPRPSRSNHTSTSSVTVRPTSALTPRQMQTQAQRPRSHSPATSSSTPDSSPSSHTSDLPTTTPSTSQEELVVGGGKHEEHEYEYADVEHDVEEDDEDDEEFYLRLLPSPRFKARRASIRPLVIAPKSTAGSPVPLVEIEQGQEGKEEQEQEQEEQADEEDEESDYEELNDWYTQQLSDILTLYSSPPSPLPAEPSLPSHSPTHFHSQSQNYTAPARPDSILSLYAPLSPIPAPTPAPPSVQKRESKPLPSIPTLPLPNVLIMPSPHLDPTFPRRKRTIVVPPSLPLPSPPPLPPVVRSSQSEAQRARRRASIRPPSCSSSSSSSNISCGSEASVYSQDQDQDQSEADLGLGYFNLNLDLNLELDADVDVDTETPLRLPLSLPSSPVDFEREFVSALALAARSHGEEGERTEGGMEPALPETPAARMYPHDHFPQHQQHHQLQVRGSHSQRRRRHGQKEETDVERILRSRWSSSTLSSVNHQQQHPPSASSRLRFYFGSRKSRRSGSVSVSGPASPMFPTSPISYLAFSPSPSRKEFQVGKGQRMSSTEPATIMRGSTGLRRSASSASTCTSRSSGSVSCKSFGSSGLRRKPIPVEMFIKC